MKSLSAIAVLFAVFSTSTASAGENIWIELPREFTQCIAACQKASSQCAPDESTAKVVQSTCTRKKARKAVASAKVQRKLRRKITRINRRLAALEASETARRDADAELEKMRGELTALTMQLEEIGAGVVGLAASHKVLLEEAGGVLDRVGAIEEKMVTLEIGPTVGGVFLWSSDGTTYSAASVGAKVSFRFRPGVYLVLEPSILLAVNDQPLGVQFRGGLGYSVVDHIDFEAGLGGIFGSLDSNLLAKSVFINGDIGVGARFGGFYAGAKLFLGAEFDAGSPSFSIGGQVTAGWLF